MEGERVSWVSVHQKTYFPPQSTASLVASYQPESTTSLSGEFILIHLTIQINECMKDTEIVIYFLFKVKYELFFACC